jgi:predicted small secreted protein
MSDAGVNTKDVIADAKAFYEAVSAYESENRAEALDDKQFIKGGAGQWDPNARRLREIEQRPCLTFNVLPTFIQQIVNDQRQNKTNIKTHPVEEGDKELNEVAQGLIKHIEYESNADVAYDRSLGNATEIGFGYWILETDYESPKSFDQVIRYKSIRNPFTVYFDPLSTEPDGSDQRKCLIAIDVAKEDYKKEYPKSELSSADWVSATGNGQDGWVTDETIRVAQFYRIEETEATLYQLPDGSAAWEEDLGEFASAKSILKSRKSCKRKTMLYKLNGFEVLETTEIKCPWIPVFPVWGTEIDINGKVYRQGMIRAAKDPARMYNVLMSAATEEVASRTKSPWIMAEGQAEGHEKKWRQANQRNFAYLEYKPTTVEGQLAPPPQRQPMVDVPAGFLTMAGHTRDDIKATTGVFDASMGAASNETSGKAILARERQGDITNFHYRDNLTRTQKHCGRCILAMIPHYYDATRIVRIMGEDESVKSVEINKPKMGAVGQFVNDMSQVAEFDITVSAGPAYQTQQQEATEAMVQLSQTNPNIMAVAGDVVVRNLPFRGADEIADRLKMALPSNIQEMIQDDKADPQVQIIKAQANQAIDQLQQQIQAAEAGIAERDAALRDAEEKAANEARKIEIDAYKAETERMKALAPAIDPGLLQQVATQAAMAALEMAQPQVQQAVMPPEEMPQMPPDFATPID